MSKIKANRIDYKSHINAGGEIGYHNADSHGRAVEAAKFCKSSKRALEMLGANYVAGYVAASLVRQGLESFGNLPVSEQVEKGRAIAALKPAKKSGDKFLPDSEQPDGYRTERQHKAVRAAAVSWGTVQRAAGIAAKRGGGRKPRPGSNEPETGNTPPVDLVKASPKLDSKEAVNDYFGTAAAALLATVDKNAKLVDPRLSTAVSDFLSAVKVALGIK